ncbi:MAG: hypothetical protein M1511_19275 [Deltaproteobacteria bacterium]|nr:hypothetical protein [Deltaproteobacteria bacterium]
MVGRFSWMFTKRLFFDESGNIIDIVDCGHDVTLERQLAEERKIAEERDCVSMRNVWQQAWTGFQRISKREESSRETFWNRRTTERRKD